MHCIAIIHAWVKELKSKRLRNGWYYIKVLDQTEHVCDELFG